MSKAINIGVLGCAAIAKRSILPTLKILDASFNLTGVASRNPGKALEFAQLFDTEPCTYESLLEQDQIEAVYIPLPNSMHAEWIDRALDRGLHVFVEKSMTTSLTDAIHLNNKAREKNLVLLENFQFRFHRQMAEIKSIVAAGTLGELRCLRASFGFPPFKDSDNIRYQKELDGGALSDAGAYPIKISQIFLGQELEVKAAKLNYDAAMGVDIWGGGFLQQTNGSLFAEIAFGFDHYYQCSLELWGSKGRLSAPRVFTAPPGYEAELLLEQNNEAQRIILPADNHFEQVLLHLHHLIHEPARRTDEYAQNINQARLIEEFKNKSNE